jgi:large subunit ribosomal protein L9
MESPTRQVHAGGAGPDMKVILRRDVKGLGREGDMKEVKDGYARNFLLPTGAAVVADRGAVANWDRHREQREARDRSVREEAEATIERLRALKIEVPVKAGERGRLFGAVTGYQIADLIHREGIDLDRHALHLREPIKTLGEHRVDVRLMPGVETTVTVNVVAAG